MRANFAPVEAGRQRPTWSVMIPTYNCARFLSDTITSVLAQLPDLEDAQIEVVDDGSSDDPAAVVASVGQGRVGFHRQSSNVGHVANFATCISRSRGRLVHLLHGDDLVFPGFYAALQAGFDADAAVGAAYCRYKEINEAGACIGEMEPEQPFAGILDDALARLASEQRIVTPSIALRRSTWEELGGFDPRLKCCEDWEMWVRVAAHCAIWYEPKVLAAYRRHERSNSGRHWRGAEELRYSQLAMQLFQPLLPHDRAPAILRHARAAYARTALRNAMQLSRTGDRAAMRAHLAAALRLRPSSRTFLRAAYIYVGGGKGA